MALAVVTYASKIFSGFSALNQAVNAFHRVQANRQTSIQRLASFTQNRCELYRNTLLEESQKLLQQTPRGVEMPLKADIVQCITKINENISVINKLMNDNTVTHIARDDADKLVTLNEEATTGLLLLSSLTAQRESNLAWTQLKGAFSCPEALATWYRCIGHQRSVLFEDFFTQLQTFYEEQHHFVLQHTGATLRLKQVLLTAMAKQSSDPVYAVDFNLLVLRFGPCRLMWFKLIAIASTEEEAIPFFCPIYTKEDAENELRSLRERHHVSTPAWRIRFSENYPFLFAMSYITHEDVVVHRLIRNFDTVDARGYQFLDDENPPQSTDLPPAAIDADREEAPLLRPSRDRPFFETVILAVEDHIRKARLEQVLAWEWNPPAGRLNWISVLCQGYLQVKHVPTWYLAKSR